MKYIYSRCEKYGLEKHEVVSENKHFFNLKGFKVSKKTMAKPLAIFYLPTNELDKEFAENQEKIRVGKEIYRLAEKIRRLKKYSVKKEVLERLEGLDLSEGMAVK